MNEPTTKRPWYADGLQFTCSQCGDCCSGGPGYVWLRDEDSQTLADHLGLTVEEFERKYTRRVGLRRSLVEFHGDDDQNCDCVFFDGAARKCTVYEHRPLQCRTWPFWGSNIATPAAWRRTCQVCPGSGQGALVPLVQIETQAKAMKL